MRAPLPRFLALLLALLAAAAPAFAALGPTAPLLAVQVVGADATAEWNPRAPLGLEVTLQHPAVADDAAPSTPVVLAPAGRAWAEAVALVITGPDGAPCPWPIQRSGTRGKQPLHLTVGGSASVVFSLPADSKRPLSPGRYSVRAILQLDDGDGWRGRAESAPLTLEVSAPRAAAGLVVELPGAECAVAGEPFTLSVTLPPPLRTAREEALRSGYTVEVRDAAGQVLPWKFEPAATPPSLPASADLDRSGLSPVLLSLAEESVATTAPGHYRAVVAWRAVDQGPVQSGEVEIELLARSGAEASPHRESSLARSRLARATAWLWRAEFSRTAEIERLTALAAPLLLAAERAALARFAAAPNDADAAAALAEVYFVEGDFDGAAAFAQAALGLWTLPAPPPEFPADEWAPTTPQELQHLSRAIAEATAARPGRVLPYLRSALAAARGTSPTPTTGVAAVVSPSTRASSASAPAAPVINLHVPGVPSTPAGAGQWAVSARASSEYRTTDYGAAQATGAPDVPRHGDSGKAWASKSPDAGEEWLELTFARAVHATGIRVVQSFNPGAIVRIDVLDAAGAATTVWRGPDATTYAKNDVGILTASFPRTGTPVAKVKLVLDAKAVAGWNEIDAVELLGDAAAE